MGGGGGVGGGQGGDGQAITHVLFDLLQRECEVIELGDGGKNKVVRMGGVREGKMGSIGG